MKATSFKIVVISDMHSSTGHYMEEARLFIDWWKRRLPHIFVRGYERDMKKAIREHCHVQRTLCEMREKYQDNPPQMIICNGDVSQTGTKEELLSAYRVLRKYFPTTRIVFVLGNHDTKSYVWCEDPWFRDFSEDQLALCKYVFEGQEPFGLISLTSEANLIYLMSDPFLLDWHRHKELSNDTHELLTRLHTVQLNFLEQALARSSSRGKKVVLAVHDPGVLLSSDLIRVLNPHREQIIMTLTGHIHARWLLYLMIVWHPLLWPTLLWRMWRYKAKLVPSVWGIALPKWCWLWMAGAGWAEVILSSTNKFIVHHTNKKRGSNPSE